MASRLTSIILVGVLLIAGVRAGTQIVLPIFNFSPLPVKLDFTGNQNCFLSEDYDSGYIRGYYSGYKSSNLIRDFGYNDHAAELNTILQAYKSAIGVYDLSKTVASMSGYFQLSPYDVSVGNIPFITFQGEMSSSFLSLCSFANSWKIFYVTVGDHQYGIKFENPGVSTQWSISMQDFWDSSKDRTVSLGDATSAARTLLTVGLTPTDTSNPVLDDIVNYCVKGLFCQPSVANQTSFLDFDGIYNTVSSDDRIVCLNVVGDNYSGVDCGAAGVGIIIQADGRPLAIPLPFIGKSW